MKLSAEAMVLASFLGDSLALGVHWIYDTEQIDRHTGRITDLLPPLEGSYHQTKKKGEFTHYGDQSLLLLRHLVLQGGQFSLPAFARQWREFFADYSGYMDRATKATLQNLEQGRSPDTSGSPSTDLGGAARMAPLIYCYRDDLEGLLTAIRAQTALSHNGPGAVDGAVFLAHSCYAILHGAPPREAFNEALANGIADIDLDLRLRRCLDQPDVSIRQAVKDFGQACSMSAALPGAVYTVLHSPKDLEGALIETAMAGGDSAARGMVVGMLLGAGLGMEALPELWLQNLAAYQEIRTALNKLP
ncbi:MAG: ADP-ribosylglycohydrolase family protein [Desulforhopalus sp.]|nr:ADP-ribosylglycohydrolase family protein [Desulforhopalus sp.]